MLWGNRIFRARIPVGCNAATGIGKEGHDEAATAVV
jgi:hypothetical protein